MSNRVSVCLKYTKEEWEIIQELAGTNRSIHSWVNTQIHAFCDKECNHGDRRTDKEQIIFWIPEHLYPRILCLSNRFGVRPASIVKRFAIDPILTEHILF